MEAPRAGRSIERGRGDGAADVVWLVAGSSLSGIAVYAYAAIGSRTLGAAGFAPISVIWTAWAITAAALAFPIQHWVIRRLHADPTEAGIRRAIPVLSGLAAALGAMAGTGGWIARETLFRDPGTTYPIVLGAIVAGAVGMGLLRGSLAGRGRFAATAGALAGENLIRVALAALGAAAGWGPSAFAFSLVAGYAVAFLWPSAFRFGRAPGEHALQLGFLTGVAFGSLLAQTVLTGGPIALALLRAPSHDITNLFVTLALFRAPYVVATGVASRITGTLTRWVLEHRTDRIRWFSLSTLAGTAAAAIVGAAAGASFVPPLLRLLFGADIDVPRSVAAIVGTGAGLALGTMALGLLLIGRARGDLVTRAWTVGLATSIVWSAVGPCAPLMRVAVAFLAGEAVALVTMSILEARMRAQSSAEGQMLEPEAGG